MKHTCIGAFALFMMFLLIQPCASLAAALGPASSIEEIRSLLAVAHEGDVIRISGDVSAAGAQPLSSKVSVRLTSTDGSRSSISALHLRDANLSFYNIDLTHSLTIEGHCEVYLLGNVSVSAAQDAPALLFDGSGTLIAERGSSITGSASGVGLFIRHNGSEFYASLEGTITGGKGATGGHGVVISPLMENGAVMISGAVYGGDGDAIGGHALNLYDLSDNAFITVDGSLKGGSGSIGGDGVQLVSAVDSAVVGLRGRIKGGTGDAYGGDAIMLMDAEGASTITLSGEFSGGDVSVGDAQPGTALQMVGPTTSLRARVNDCLLEDGQHVPTSVAKPGRVTPLPALVASLDSDEMLEFVEETVTPLSEVIPEPTAAPSPAASPESTATPEPTAMPEPTMTPGPTEAPDPTTTPAPTPMPEPTMTFDPTSEPMSTAAPEPTEAPEASEAPAVSEQEQEQAEAETP